jgi:sulfate permease, SulP family
MLTTVVATVATGNLAIGVVVGVLVASVLFVRRVAHFANVQRELTEDERGPVATYTVEGELFFASSNDLYTMFDYAGDPSRVVIDFTRSHLWDASTVAAVDSVVDKYAKYGTTVEIRGLNPASRRMRVRMSGQLGG